MTRVHAVTPRGWAIVALWAIASATGCRRDADCTAEGDEIVLKLIGARCCGNLHWISTGFRQDSGVCAMLSPADIQVCARCGDGRCGPGENDCNCPTDCALDGGAHD
jgi:hypothetical protein